MAKLDDKDLYEHIVQTYRYFLDWRAKLFIGYFAVLAALGYAFTWVCEKNHTRLMLIIPIAGFVSTVVLWLADRRNRDQYFDCMKAGEILENRAESTTGMFLEMGFRHRRGDDSFSHSRTIDIAFGLASLGFAALLGYLLYGPCATNICQ